MTDPTFQHGAHFEHGEVSGNLHLGRLESVYEELFADVIEDGVITAEERLQLDKMADSLGLDRGRLRRLEEALQAAYEAKHRVSIREIDSGDRAPSLLPLEPASDPRTLALQRRIQSLEARVRELETALEEAQSHVVVDVDLSDISPAAGKARADDDPVELLRILRHDPRDESSLHGLFRVARKSGDVDRAYCAAQATTFLGIQTPEEGDFFLSRHASALIQPKLSVTSEAWSRLLAHPDQEPIIGDILSVVAPAVLLGRISAMRRDKQLPRLDPSRRQDPVLSTIQAVRCISWAAALLGMKAPPIFADPDFTETMDLVPAMPIATRLGAKALGGRTTGELAFLAGQHLTLHRAEYVVRSLVPSVRDLEEIYLAALSIGNPGLPMNAGVRQTVVPIAKAIEPILEPSAVDHLRGHFLRFVEEGGRANLQRWAAAVEKTAARAGLLLSNDLRAAHTVFRLGLEADIPDAPALPSAQRTADGKSVPPKAGGDADRRMDDLLVFVTSDRYAKLRKQIGIAFSA